MVVEIDILNPDHETEKFIQTDEDEQRVEINLDRILRKQVQLIDGSFVEM